MRNYIYGSLLLLAVSSTSVYAQHNEIDFSSGIGSGTGVFNISDWLMGNDFRPSKPAFTYSISYSHYLKHHISLGFALCYFADQGTNKYQNSLFNSSDSILGTYKRQTFIIAPEASFPYYIEHGFKLYVRVNIGMRFSYEEFNYYSSTHYQSSDHQLFMPVAQITPLAMRFGTHVGGFVEFGWGYKGMINLGLFCKL